MSAQPSPVHLPGSASDDAVTRHSAPLSHDDLAQLRQIWKERHTYLGLGLFLFVLMVAATALFSLPLLESGSLRRVELVFVLLPTATLALTLYIGWSLTRLPSGWRHLRDAVQGQRRKTIIGGILTSLQPAPGAGLQYQFDTLCLPVALPGWSDVLSNTHKGMRVREAHALTGLPVRLHLLTLHPDSPPLLLRADYADHTAQQVSAPLTDADKALLHWESSLNRTATWVIGALGIVAGLFEPFILVGVAMVSGIMLWRHFARKRIGAPRDKQIVTGVIDEILRYRTRGPTGSHHDRLLYRVGGQLYAGGGEGRFRVGQRIALSYLQTRHGGALLSLEPADDGARAA